MLVCEQKNKVYGEKYILLHYSFPYITLAFVSTTVIWKSNHISNFEIILEKTNTKCDILLCWNNRHLCGKLFVL